MKNETEWPQSQPELQTRQPQKLRFFWCSVWRSLTQHEQGNESKASQHRQMWCCNVMYINVMSENLTEPPCPRNAPTWVIYRCRGKPGDWSAAKGSSTKEQSRLHKYNSRVIGLDWWPPSNRMPGLISVLMTQLLTRYGNGTEPYDATFSGMNIRISIRIPAIWGFARVLEIWTPILGPRNWIYNHIVNIL